MTTHPTITAFLKTLRKTQYLSPERLLAYHRRLQAARPACIVAYASALADLAAVVAEAGGGAPEYPRRCFVTGGEKLHASQRELVERVFGKPVQLQGGGTATADEGYIRDSILLPQSQVVAGYQPVMPSFKGQVSEEQILQLIAFIKSLSSEQQPGTPSGQGAPEALQTAQPQSTQTP